MVNDIQIHIIDFGNNKGAVKLVIQPLLVSEQVFRSFFHQLPDTLPGAFHLLSDFGQIHRVSITNAGCHCKNPIQTILRLRQLIPQQEEHGIVSVLVVEICNETDLFLREIRISVCDDGSADLVSVKVFILKQHIVQVGQETEYLTVRRSMEPYLRQKLCHLFFGKQKHRDSLQIGGYEPSLNAPRLL